MTYLNQVDFTSIESDDKNEEFKLLNTISYGVKSFYFCHPTTF